MNHRDRIESRESAASRGARRRVGGRAGYTVPELLVTFALVGIVAGFAVPRLDWARWQADAGARQLRVALQLAQRIALTEQSTVVVGVDSANARVRILEDVNGNLSADLPGEHVMWRPLDGKVRFIAPPTPAPGTTAGGAVANIGAHTVDGLPSIIFRRDGSASASAALYVGMTRRGQTEYRGLVVTQSTGRVDWWRAAGATGASLSWIRGNL